MADPKDHRSRPDRNRKAWLRVLVARIWCIGSKASNVQEIKTTQRTDSQVEGPSPESEILRPKHVDVCAGRTTATIRR